MTKPAVDTNDDNNDNGGGIDVTTTTTNTPRSFDDFLDQAYDNGSGSSSVKYKYWIMILSMGMANSAEATEILCLSFLLADPSFDRTMLTGPGAASGLAAAVFFGMLVGGLVSGMVSDLVGRRRILVWGLWTNAITGLLSATTQDVWQLSLLRTVTGLGVGASIPPLFTLAAELSPRTSRGFLVSVVAAFFMVGSIYVALVALVLHNTLRGHAYTWRLFCVFCIVPSVTGAILITYSVPESMRYLALHQRYQQALEATLAVAAKMNYTGPPLTLEEVLFHYPTNNNNNKGELSLLDTEAQPSSSRDNSNKCVSGVVDFVNQTVLLYQSGMWRTTLPIQLIWTTLCFGSYGMSTWIYTLFRVVHLHNLYYNALIFNCANLPANLLSVLLMDRWGRRNMLLTSAMTAACTLLVFAAFASLPTPPTLGIVLSACVYQGFTTVAWNTIDTMTAERFPTKIRSTGLGVAAASGRVGAAAAQFVNAALVSRPAHLLMVASLSFVVTGCAPFLLPGQDMALESLADTVGGKTNDDESAEQQQQQDGEPTESTSLVS